MQTSLQLRVSPAVAAQPSLLRQRLCEELAIADTALTDFRIIGRSIDARQHRVMVQLRVVAYIGEAAPEVDFHPIDYPNVEKRPCVIVVGAGPAGLFAALRLIELGLRPIVVERGADVHQRRKDIAQISRQHQVNAESNYSFGEGGAGAFSDGKLYTRSKKRGNVEKILQVFCQMGASHNILIDAHPHIGTDRLPKVIEQMREVIISHGGEVHFHTRVETLLFDTSKTKVIGVAARQYTNDDNREVTFLGSVVLATGHSARDVYRYLATSPLAIEAKGIAIGVRLEHPAALIDRIQYHNREGRGKYLPAAEYNFVCQQDGRGVYSFCMCPGGFVVPAATGPEQVVVNGMSPSSRAGRWSNSGMVVETHPEDVISEMGTYFSTCECETPAANDPLCVMYLQEALEQMTWLQGGRRQTAPSQRMTDFVNGRLTSDLPPTSYTPGVQASPLHFWLPPFITQRLQGAFRLFGKRSRGFLTSEASLIAVETRTSAPVRILRTNDTLQSISVAGLFPCGEGAGYAGGIVSAAIDGERCAEAAAKYVATQGANI